MRKDRPGRPRSSSSGRRSRPTFEEVIMDYDVLMQFIQTLGFPIVVCCALFWYVNKQAENHKDEIDSLRTTIQDNTTLLHEVKELISALIGKAKEL